MGDRADAVVTVMEGKGFYNANSSLQAAGIAPLIPLWERTLRSIDVGSGPIAVAEHASSEGRNSMAPIKIAIRELRAIAGTDRQVEVVHTDLPSNDFSSLFRTLENDPESYLTGTAGVYSSAVG